MFSRRSFLNVAFAYPEKRARSRLPPPADFHSPRSTDSSNSFSSASIFMVGLLTEVLLRGLPAWDDRLQEHRVLVLDERHQVHVVLALDDEDALAGVAVGVRVFQDIEQVATLDVKDDVLEPDAAIRLELRVLRVVPGEVLHCCQRSTTCAQQAHVGIGLSVPRSVPKRGPRTIIPQPTPTKVPIKNGPEIIDFRPVLGFPAALANRRLRPLGHLTARLQVYVTKILTTETLDS